MLWEAIWLEGMTGSFREGMIGIDFRRIKSAMAFFLRCLARELCTSINLFYEFKKKEVLKEAVSFVGSLGETNNNNNNG